MHSGTKFLFKAFLFFSFTWLGLRFFLPFALPFLLGAGLALSAEPVTVPLRNRLGLPGAAASGIGVSCTFFLFSFLLFGLLSLLLQILMPAGQILPDLLETALSGLGLLEQWILSLSGKLPRSLRPLAQQHIRLFFGDSTAFLTKGLKYVFSLAGGILTHIPDQAFTLFTALISSFMISSRLPRIRLFLKKTFPPEKREALLNFLTGIKNTAGRWLLAQLKLTGVTLLILTLGLILLRIPYAPVWAFCIALLDALPILGTGTVLIPWSLISLLQENRVQALGLGAIYAAAALTRSLLEPRFVGKQLGLDPLITLASIYLGYRLWGFGGMILSPLLAVAALGLIPNGLNSGKQD